MNIPRHRWIAVSRPKTLVVSVVPVIVGASLALRNTNIEWSFFALTLIAAVLIQITTNLVNDLADFEKGADTSERLGPPRSVSSGYIQPSELKRAITLTVIAALVSGSILIGVGGLPIFLIGASGLLCAVAYTSGPAPLAYLGIADLFVLIYFGPIALLGTVYLLTGVWDTSLIPHGFAFGAVATALLVVNNVRDVEGDRKAHKRTLVVRFGAFAGRLFYGALVLSAPVLMAFGSGEFSPLVLLFPGAFIVRTFWRTEGRELNRFLGLTVMYLVLLALGALLYPPSQYRGKGSPLSVQSKEALDASQGPAQ